ncbi:hypothetical protein BC939DRAFT_474030 [Gamsiella multidivaricata]|uniref:uncharacterized protein n=1 Tax=Gamsiella multidivaricata TaxID=101098 RepID=UPI00221ECA7C|nr:uncharacterized protein BC939DRAFT_474030 [Gamsiella multidivaricata]KAI7829837.1 hypothetical protein BC939DRAFT_474030 [Gamsiella multidivaricata]
MLPPPKATLLLLFVHGFKGHDHHTFLDFPTRIMTIFTNAKLNLDVESIVYPQYDTRGDFSAAVKTFAEWTQQQVKSRQEFNNRVYSPRQNEAKEMKPSEMKADQADIDEKTVAKETEDKIPPVFVCVIGHSMGGLVAADAALLLHSLPERSPVIGILAFDTPYFGLNHTIFTQAAYERATGLAQKASGAYSLVSAYLPAAAAWGTVSTTTTKTSSDNKEREEQKREGGQSSSTAPSGFNPTSLWSATSSNEKTVTTTSTSSSKWGWGSIALGVGAAVAATGAAYVVNNHMNKGMEYITSHIQFVGILWSNAQLKQRVANVLELPIGFHCFYTQIQIPASSSNNWRPSSRTFVELSSIPNGIREHFSARECSGQDEIEAHMEMFNPGKNFDYYQMGDETVKRIKVMVEDALKREP